MKICIFYPMAVPLLIFVSMTQLMAEPFLKLEQTSAQFGDAFQGEQKTVHFNFENSGTSELIIQGVHSECGCTSVNDIVGQVYFPKDKGQLTVKIDTQRFEGKFNKKIIIATNSRGLSSKTVRVKGHIESLFSASPPMLYAQHIKRDKILEMLLEIKTKTDKTFKSSDLESASDFLEVKETDKKNHFKVLLDPSGMNYGHFKSTLVLDTGDKRQRELRIPVRGHIESNITSSKKYIEFGAIEPGKEKEIEVEVKGVLDWSSAKVESKVFAEKNLLSTADISLDFLPPEEQNSSKKVKIKIKRNSDLTGPINGFVNISQGTDSIQIPLYGYLY